MKLNGYQRSEARLLQRLPAAVTPLRLRILFGYLLVLILAIAGWEQLSAAWRYLATLFAPAFALLGALLALKLSVVVVSLFTLVTAVIKLFFAFVIAVLKPGIIKAILMPQLLALAAWIHNKSQRLQQFFSRYYEVFKLKTERVLAWWRSQLVIDKILLSGFLIPLFVVVMLVFIIKQAVAIFAVKKLTEQLVQRLTKLVLKNLNRLPSVSGVTTRVSETLRDLSASPVRNTDPNRNDKGCETAQLVEKKSEMGAQDSEVDVPVSTAAENNSAKKRKSDY